jgi:predicted O-methyltransferase YrrM
VFLDGWNNLYLSIVDLLEPRLSAGALVVADLSADDPEQVPYCERMHDPARGYVSLTVPLDAGVVVSSRVGEPGRRPASGG